ncbi:MAG TPA: hypothetical protein VHX39_24015, partial [Acetobacteraceae bacterium]|nr:hypothetical protein [Acetobacteraceae bacterium]
MRSLNNASITVKSLMSTLVGAVVLIAMALLTMTSLLEFQRANDLQNATTLAMSQTRDSWIDLSRGQAALYRAINLKSQNVEIGTIRAAKNEFTQASTHAKHGLDSLKLTTVAIDPALATKAAQTVEQYLSASNQAASFVEEDAFNATMFMTDSEQKYDAAQQAVAALLKGAIAADDAIDQQMDAMVHARLMT